MPINLTTPQHGFSQVKITMMRIDLERSMIFLTFCLGDTVDGTFVRAPVIPEEKLVRNIPQVLDGQGGELEPEDREYDDLIGSAASNANDHASPGDNGHRVYIATARNLYEHAIARGWYDGTPA